jgi:hypothetical protein
MDCAYCAEQGVSNSCDVTASKDKFVSDYFKVVAEEAKVRVFQ